MQPRMRVLVTGSTGYLGRRVVERLLDGGCRIVAVGRNPSPAPFSRQVEYHVADLTVENALVPVVQRPDTFTAVIHLAGPAPKIDSGWGAEGGNLVATHVRLALGVRAAFSGWNGRVIHASGMPVYGFPERLPIDETAPRRPWHMYGLAKVLSEDVMLTWAGTDRWVLRLPGLFSGDRRSGGLFHFMRAAAAGEAVRVTADRPMVWDVLSVDDAVEAIWRALVSDARDPGPVNVSYGEVVDVMSVARWIAAHAGRGSAVENVHRIEHPSFQMNIERAKRLLGWPPATLHQRLAELFRSYAFEP